jgi:hypothetical protein
VMERMEERIGWDDEKFLYEMESVFGRFGH